MRPVFVIVSEGKIRYTKAKYEEDQIREQRPGKERMMNDLRTTPAADGFYMPAEYAPHRGCVMIWPVRPGSWPHGGMQAQQTFGAVARAIARSETVWMLAAPADVPAAEAAFAGDENIHVLPIPTDDAWARDVGPTCVVDGKGHVRGEIGRASCRERVFRAV